MFTPLVIPPKGRCTVYSKDQKRWLHRMRAEKTIEITYHLSTFYQCAMIARRKVLGCHLWRHATCRWPHRWIVPCHPPSNSSALIWIWKQILNGFMMFYDIFFDIWWIFPFSLCAHKFAISTWQHLSFCCMLQSLSTMASVYSTVIKETWRLHPYTKKEDWVTIFYIRLATGS